MLKAVRLSNILGILLVALGVLFPSAISAEETVHFKNNETSIGRDIFEQNFYYEATNYLRLDRLYRALFRKKVKAKDINVFDEVPDNTFFTNRHARKALTPEEIYQGASLAGAAPLSGPLTIQGGHFGEVDTYLLVKDNQGNDYKLKFDHADYVELETGAEMVANRIYYALGYNVPEETTVNLEASQLVLGENSRVVDGSGFSEKLTQEKLDQHLMFVAQTDGGQYRVTASKAIKGEPKGGFRFQGRRRNDPHDGYDHEARRELRALQVFASWLNHVDIRPENTMDVLVDEAGSKILKHYILDVDASLGADSHGAKPAHFGYEYFADYGETAKAILGLGVWEKPWQKCWREGAEKPRSAVQGYFESGCFDPEKFKTQLPNYGFKDLTRADGFWAAKQIMSFEDADIEAAVRAASYSNPEDAQAISKMLALRRDIVARYWFSTANPLDFFDIQSGKIIFEDLAIKHQFAETSGTLYHAEVVLRNSKKGKPVASLTSAEPFFSLDPNWGTQVNLSIRVSRGGDSSKMSPYALVEITDGKVTGVNRED